MSNITPWEDIKKYLFPKIKVICDHPKTIYERNNIIQETIIVYGGPGSGKTSVIMRIVEEAWRSYGSQYVNARYSKEDIVPLLEHGWGNVGEDAKRINILVADDLTLVKVPQYVLAKMFNIRHLMKEATRYSEGLVLLIIAVHKYSAIPNELRQEPYMLLFRSIPENPYHKNQVKKWLGEDIMNKYRQIVYHRRDDPSLRGLTAYYNFFGSGIFDLPLASIDLLEEAKPTVVEKKGIFSSIASR